MTYRNRVIANKGAPGVDGMNVNQLSGYLKRHWVKVKEDLLNAAILGKSVKGSLLQAKGVIFRNGL